MEIVKGSVVRSIAGRDKDVFFIVFEVDDSFVTLVDGRTRRLEKPKTKRKKHVRATKTVLDTTPLTTDRSVRRVLAPYNNPQV